MELERSQLNGDRLTGGGVGCADVDCVGKLEDDRKADERPLALDWGGAVAGGAGGLTFAAAGTAEPEELPDDRENLFVIDSTNDGVCGGGGGGEGGVASAGGVETLDGGRSSIRETSSSEVIESRL